MGVLKKKNNDKVLKNAFLQRLEVSMLFAISHLPNLIINTLKKKSFYSRFETVNNN